MRIGENDIRFSMEAYKMPTTTPNPHNRGRKLPPEPLTDDEIDRLAAVPNPRCPTGARHRALILVLAHSGARISEALYARPKDYDARRGTLRLLKAKGGKHRTVPVSGAAATALAAWMAHRALLGLPSTAPLFCTLQGGPMATANVRELLPRLARRAGIEKRVHPHGLRHTFAVEALRRGVRINTLSKALGHSNVGTTSTYVDHVGDPAMVEEIRNAWR